MERRRIHILGASGSGTTTLGAALAERMATAHFDTDAFFWLPTEPPFQQTRPVEARKDLLRTALAQEPYWALSGALSGWGDEFIPQFDLVVFLFVPPDVRLERLRAREQVRHGARIEPGGDMHQTHIDFMAWAQGYDSPQGPGRNLANQRAWLAALPCPVLEIAGTPTLAETLEMVSAA